MHDKIKIGKFAKPGYLFAVTIISIFIAEFVLMILLSFIQLESALNEAILDAVLLSILIFPILFFMVLNPMRHHIDQREKIEAEKEKLLKAEIKILRGYISICASCKNVLDDKGLWQQVEHYVSSNSEAKFTHGICPDCMDIHYPKWKYPKGK